jgi:hypothetical protein
MQDLIPGIKGGSIRTAIDIGCGVSFILLFTFEYLVSMAMQIESLHTLYKLITLCSSDTCVFGVTCCNSGMKYAVYLFLTLHLVFILLLSIDSVPLLLYFGDNLVRLKNIVRSQLRIFRKGNLIFQILSELQCFL